VAGSGDSRIIYGDEQITPQIMQIIQQHQNNINLMNQGRERIRKARDPLQNSTTENDTLNLITQISKKNIELQQQVEKSKVNISADMIAQINRQGGILNNLHKMKAFNLLQN
jgi:hypothetical protein